MQNSQYSHLDVAYFRPAEDGMTVFCSMTANPTLLWASRYLPVLPTGSTSSTNSSPVLSNLETGDSDTAGLRGCEDIVMYCQ